MDAFFPECRLDILPRGFGFCNLDPRAWQVRGSLITRRGVESVKGTREDQGLREGRGEDQLAGAGGWKLSMKNAWMIRESRRKIIS